MQILNFIRNLVHADPEILNCRSKEELINTLEILARIARFAAEIPEDNEEISILCGIKDNIYQLPKLLN